MSDGGELSVGQGIIAGSWGGEWKSKYWSGCLLRTVCTRWAGHLLANREVEALCGSKKIVGLCVKRKGRKKSRETKIIFLV